MKKHISSKIFIVLILTTSTLIFMNSLVYEESSKFGFGTKNLKQNSLIISDPIHIYDNQDWIDLKNAGKCSGEGTQIDPYILSNLKIDAKGLGSAILLDHQTVYFKIINSELFNSSGSGIFMYFSDNAEILNNSIYSNEYGIKFDGSYYNNILIQGNNIFNNTQSGIYGGNIYDSEISDNTIEYNGGYGIYLSGHNERVNLLNNNISYNFKAGMWLISGDYFEIRGNTINYNGRGLWFWSSDYNSITENDINYNEGGYNYQDHGIYFDDSNNNSVENNNITDNGDREIYFDESNDNIIRYNNIIETYPPKNIYWTGNINENNNIQHDDDLEYNDFFRDAKAITLGYYSNLIAIDEDWYKVYIGQPSQCTISINYSLSGDLLDLYLYNSIGLLLNYSDSGLPILFQTTFPDYYYIQVSNGINLNYELSISRIIIDFPPNITINSPTINDAFGLNAPDFDLTINDESPINTTWYTIDNGTTNYTFSGLTGIVNQSGWNNKGTEQMRLRFYAKDPFEQVGFKDVIIWKDLVAPKITINSPTPNQLCGVDAPTFTLTIDEPNIQIKRYSINERPNITFTAQTQFNQAEWDNIGNGTVSITFYVIDKVGNANSSKVLIRKDANIPDITIFSPIPSEIFRNTPPEFNISIIDDDLLVSTWYKVQGSFSEYPIWGLTGTVDQGAWDTAFIGEITITFYAQDKAGNVGTETVTIIKSIPSSPVIPGYNMFWLIGAISVVLTIIVRIKHKNSY